uniref:(northern house mosquito) hypothetical protein n=1 Tax=Culex pipiens TaxID=7175 RepID=A0A8D8CPY5_CULPI
MWCTVWLTQRMAKSLRPEVPTKRSSFGRISSRGCSSTPTVTRSSACRSTRCPTSWPRVPCRTFPSGRRSRKRSRSTKPQPGLTRAPGPTMANIWRWAWPTGSFRSATRRGTRRSRSSGRGALTVRSLGWRGILRRPVRRTFCA